MNTQERSSDVADVAQSSPVFPAWRTEPEISDARQAFLRERLTVVPDIQQGIYPFKGITLTRGDIEWLLAMQEQGPIEWKDLAQRKRRGIDLRGAHIQHSNLRNLPLACVVGGLTQEEWVATTQAQRILAGVHLEHTDLSGAHLEGALLRGAFLQGASLRETILEQAVLFQAHLEGAYLRKAHLEGANLMYAHLEGTYLRKAHLEGADLRHAICDNTTNLEKATLFEKTWGCVLLADVHWGDCNLAVLNWRRVFPLGDEVFARKQQRAGTRSFRGKRFVLDTYQAAARAYRQLANAMRAQGMNEEAMPLAYRAQILQRTILRQRLLWGSEVYFEERGTPTHISQSVREVLRRLRIGVSYLLSWFLDIIAGYGYKPERSLGIYLLTVILFMLVYHFAGDLPLGQALIFSVTAFHGRGFLIGPFTLASSVTALAAFEAVIGLFIEISFIATFTQRSFGR